METQMVISSAATHPRSAVGTQRSTQTVPNSSKRNSKFHELNDDDARALRKLKRAIESFRALDPRMPTSYVDAFLSVCLEPGKGPTDYAQDMGTIQPIASRVLLEIGGKARLREESLELVDRQVSDASLRNQEYFLTPKGRQLMNQLLKIWKEA